jgi:hypothetical protein
MKLLAALAATTATELNLGKATAVAVYASAITIIKTVANDGTEGGTSGTVKGSITLPAASLTVIHKDSDQFLLANVTNGTYTKIASSGT